jgi:hypothetical protein
MSSGDLRGEIIRGSVQLVGIGIQTISGLLAAKLAPATKNALDAFAQALYMAANADAEQLSPSEANQLTKILHSPGSVAGMVGVQVPTIKAGTTRMEAREAIVSARDRFVREAEGARRSIIAATFAARSSGDTTQFDAVVSRLQQNLVVTGQENLADQMTKIASVDVSYRVSQDDSLATLYASKANKAVITSFLQALVSPMSISGCSGERTTIVVPNMRSLQPPGTGSSVGYASVSAQASWVAGYTNLVGYAEVPDTLTFTGTISPNLGSSQQTASAAGTWGLHSTLEVDGAQLPLGVIYPLSSTAARGDVTKSIWTGDLETVWALTQYSVFDSTMPSQGVAVIIESQLNPAAIGEWTNSSQNFAAGVKKVHAIIPFQLNTNTIYKTASPRTIYGSGRIPINVETSGNSGVFVLVFPDPSGWNGDYASGVSLPYCITDGSNMIEGWMKRPADEFLRTQKVSTTSGGSIAAVEITPTGNYWRDLDRTPVDWIGKVTRGPGYGSGTSSFPTPDLGVGTLSDYLSTVSRFPISIWHQFIAAVRANRGPNLPTSPSDIVFNPTDDMKNYAAGYRGLVLDLVLANMNLNWIEINS